MSKYFIEKEEEKILISEFIKELEESTKGYEEKYGFKHPEQRTIVEAQWLIKYLGDVKLSKSMIKVLTSQFHCYGGRYDVRCERKTIEEIYQIHKMYPELSSAAIDEIIFIYIKDLFDKYSLVDMLGKFIKVMDKSDETFSIYCDYVDRKGEELQKEYETKAKYLDEYISEYGVKYVDYLKTLVLRYHIDVDKIISSMPSVELIKEDEKQLLELATRTRIHMGCGYPVSYILTKLLSKGESLDIYPEELVYKVSVLDHDVKATFTKEEFLKSVQKIKRK